MRISVSAVLVVTMLVLRQAQACDLCSVYAATEAQGGNGKGFFSGLAEQFTHFGTLQDNSHNISGEGQYIDSSISQLFAGYNFNRRFGLQLNLPVIYRAYGSDTMHSTVGGIGDLSLIGSFTAYRKLAETFSFSWTLLGGIKFPTGDPSKLNTPESDLPEGIGGHDLALGSGSYDGLVGTSVFVRWKRLFLTGGVQYAIRSEGAFEHQYANDLTWSVGPGAYLALEDNYSLSFQVVGSGETKGKDTFAGVPDEDSAETITYVGPQINFTRGSTWSVSVGADFPVNIRNSGTQVVPDYRVRGAFNWSF
jgi:hypothetical protein